MENLYCLFPYRIYELSFKGSPTVEKLVKGEAVIPGVSLLGRRQGLQRRHRACAALGGRPRAGCGPGRFLLGGGLLPASGARRAVCGSSGWCRPRSAFIRTRLALHVRASHRPVAMATPVVMDSRPAWLQRGRVLTDRLCDSPAPRVSLGSTGGCNFNTGAFVGHRSTHNTQQCIFFFFLTSCNNKKHRVFVLCSRVF